MDIKNVIAVFNEQNPDFRMRLGELLEDVATSMCYGTTCAGINCCDCPFENTDHPEDRIAMMGSMIEEMY